MFALVLSILPFVLLVFHDVYTKGITRVMPRCLDHAQTRPDATPPYGSAEARGRPLWIAPLSSAGYK